ncbi:la-related protein 6-like isoform X1 [Paramormyrops kingsleyae]|uniref:la-related protein 6-like isoform X1 n=2 Tax=Paramormyrops kingsleyae TaxID=1676925 RepID=UPI003B9799FA
MYLADVKQPLTRKKVSGVSKHAVFLTSVPVFHKGRKIATNVSDLIAMDNSDTTKNNADNASNSGNNEDIDLDDWTPPGADLVQKMVSQVEFYLSDENLAKDAFLLKHVKRNRMGYVNIKLLTSFKKMKQLTKDWRVTAYALHHSLKLELNKERTKVRRKAPIPESLLVQAPSRLLLVWNIPEPSHRGDVTQPPRSSMEVAIAILSPFGTISTIRLIRPGKELPPEIRKYIHRYPELGCLDCVLVEYEDLGGAGRAYRELSRRGGAVRALLVRRSTGKMSGLGVDHMEDRCDGRSVGVLIQRMTLLQHGVEDESDSSSMLAPCSSPNPLGVSPKSSPRCPRLPRAPLPGPLPLAALVADSSPKLGCPDQGDFPQLEAGASSLRMQSYKLPNPQAPTLEGNLKVSHLGQKKTQAADPVPLGVTHHPQGPDETTGFHSTAGRGRSPSNF